MAGNKRNGNLTVVYGTMFSDKTIRLVNEFEKIKPYRKEVGQAFKPLFDDRYSLDEIVINKDKKYEQRIPATSIETIDDFYSNLKPETTHCFFDEFQFLNSDFVPLVLDLIKDNKNVLLTGLTTNYRGETYFMLNPDGSRSDLSLWDLINVADEKVHLYSLCQYKNEKGKPCASKAHYCQRFEGDKIAPYDAPTNVTGNDKENESKVTYSVRCKDHFVHYKETGLGKLVK